MDPDPSVLPFHRSGLIIHSLKGLDFSPFARHYLGNAALRYRFTKFLKFSVGNSEALLFISFPPATKMFQFTG